MAHHWPKEILIWHCNSSLMGQRVQLIMIILSLTALTFFQDVFPMAYILTIAELNWPTLQNMLKTLMHNYIYMCVCVWVCSVQSLNCRLCCTNWRVKIHRLHATICRLARNLQTAILIVQSVEPQIPSQYYTFLKVAFTYYTIEVQMNECCSMCIKEVMGKAKLTIKNSNDTTKLNCRCFHKNCETSLCISGTYVAIFFFLSWCSAMAIYWDRKCCWKQA